MFTGIIEEVGEVVAYVPGPEITRIRLRAPGIAATLGLGDSVSTAGVCLTVTRTDESTFDIEAMPATTRATTVGSWAVGTRVDLERALRADGRLDGHIVQGHVDHISTVLAVRDGAEWRVVRFSLPAAAAGAVVAKGSICVDGVSLTVSDVSQPHTADEWFEVSLIPTTLALTTLGALRPGDAVNIETDVIARHVERLLALSAVAR